MDEGKDSLTPPSPPHLPITSEGEGKNLPYPRRGGV